MEELTPNSEYLQYKATLDSELKKSAESFVRIGYLLKIARDSDILRSSGYADVVEFAKAEYNLDKSATSRFIHINERFAQGQEYLLPQYEDMGVAKLALMLTLPDEINENLTADYTKSEIQAIKEEYEEEKKVSDIEVYLEGTDAEQADLSTEEKVINQMLHDSPELLEELDKVNKSAFAAGRPVIAKEIAMILAPSDVKSYSVRIQGEGRYMVMLNGLEKDVRIVSMRTSETIDVPWGAMTIFFSKIAALLYEHGVEEYFQTLYHEEFPKKEAEKPENTKVAPVQQKKSEPKKETKVVKAPSPKVEKAPEAPILQKEKPISEEKEENAVSEPEKTAEKVDFTEREGTSESREVEQKSQDDASKLREVEDYGEVEEIEEIETNPVELPKDFINEPQEQQADVVDMPTKSEVQRLLDYQDRIIEKLQLAIKHAQERHWDSIIMRMEEAKDLIMDAELIEDAIREAEEKEDDEE